MENRLLETVGLANGYREKNEKLEQMLNEAQNSLRTNKEYIKLLEMEKIQLSQQLEQFTKDLAEVSSSKFGANDKVEEAVCRFSNEFYVWKFV